MTVMNNLLIFLLCFSYSQICIGGGENSSTFLPTDSWKTIEDGQAIPAGLHVRINLQTGKKEAKLMDRPKPSDEEKSKSLISLEQTDEETSVLNEIKDALKNIKPDDGAIRDNTEKKYRSYEELKTDFKEFQMNIKTDVEIMTDLVEKFLNITKGIKVNEADTTQILAILSDLEYLVHQYDNAVEFASANGFSEIILPCLNVTDNSEIREGALLLLGSAVQSNPKVQRAAFEAGCINVLLKVLVLDNDPTVRSRGLFALSCLIRHFPAIQLKFVQEGGISVLSKVFDDEKHSSEKNRLKIVIFLTDLLVEAKHSSTNPTRKEQYELIGMELYLREQGWCKRVSEWFCKQVQWKDVQTMEEEDLNHSAVEAATDLILALSDSCLEDFFTNINLHNVVNHVKEFYGDLVLKEQDEGISDSYYSDLLRKLRLLAVTLARTNEFKDEL